MSYQAVNSWAGATPSRQWGGGYGSFGATSSFSAKAVYADVQLSAASKQYAHLLYNCAPSLAHDEVSKKFCSFAQSKAAESKAAEVRATTAIQKGLTALMFSPGPVDGKWGPLTQGAWNNFKATKSEPVGAVPGITFVALQKMESALSGGVSPSATPGGGAILASSPGAAATQNGAAEEGDWWSRQPTGTKVVIGVAAVAVGYLIWKQLLGSSDSYAANEWQKGGPPEEREPKRGWAKETKKSKKARAASRARLRFADEVDVAGLDRPKYAPWEKTPQEERQWKYPSFDVQARHDPSFRHSGVTRTTPKEMLMEMEMGGVPMEPLGRSSRRRKVMDPLERLRSEEIKIASRTMGSPTYEEMMEWEG
jgi:hypothetical protein